MDVVVNPRIEASTKEVSQLIEATLGAYGWNVRVRLYEEEGVVWAGRLVQGCELRVRAGCNINGDNEVEWEVEKFLTVSEPCTVGRAKKALAQEALDIARLLVETLTMV